MVQKNVLAFIATLLSSSVSIRDSNRHTVNALARNFFKSMPIFVEEDTVYSIHAEEYVSHISCKLEREFPYSVRRMTL
jgi:hypothetical protein